MAESGDLQVSGPTPQTPNFSIFTSQKPPKVTQTVTTEGQIPIDVWNSMLTEMHQLKAEHSVMKKASLGW